jgi:hypothetical protein
MPCLALSEKLGVKTNTEAEKYFSSSKSKCFVHLQWDGMLRDVPLEV